MADISDLFDVTELYRILFNTVLSNDMRQIEHTGRSTTELHKMFDKKYGRRNAMWGGGYPRPSIEYFTDTYLTYDAKADGCLIDGNKAYDLKTLPRAVRQWTHGGAIKQKTEADLTSSHLLTTSQKPLLINNMQSLPSEEAEEYSSPKKRFDSDKD